MNVFRLVGDLSHLLAIIFLLMKIWKSRSCAGLTLPMFLASYLVGVANEPSVQLSLFLPSFQMYNALVLVNKCVATTPPAVGM